MRWSESCVLVQVIDKACLMIEDGWILTSFFLVYLLTSTLSPSIKMQKKDLANIQPSWPQAWSVMQIYWLLSPFCGSTHVMACGSSYFIIKRTDRSELGYGWLWHRHTELNNFAWVKSRTLLAALKLLMASAFCVLSISTFTHLKCKLQTIWKKVI